MTANEVDRIVIQRHTRTSVFGELAIHEDISQKRK